MTNRSYLYVPAHRPEMVARADERGADAVILDLEDSVPDNAKVQARESAAAAIATISTRRRCEVWVRCNPGTAMATDLSKVAKMGLGGVFLPKADPDVVAEASRLLGVLEDRRGITPGSIGVIPLVETASAVIDARVIANASTRVRRLGIGEVDLAGDLGTQLSDPLRQFARIQVVMASSAAQIAPPIGPTSLELLDMEELVMTTQELHALGFFGRTAVHPRQIPLINAEFTPTRDEVELAREIVASYSEMKTSGIGAARSVDGLLIDQAVVRRAQAILEVAAKLSESD